MPNCERKDVEKELTKFFLETCKRRAGIVAGTSGIGKSLFCTTLIKKLYYWSGIIYVALKGEKEKEKAHIKTAFLLNAYRKLKLNY